MPRGRWLAAGAAALFVLSTSFPIATSLLRAEQAPAWMGYLDVGLAFLLVLYAAVLVTATQKRMGPEVVPVSYRLYRALAGLPLLLLVVFFLFGDSVRWNVLLPGLAWRAWLLLYSLPYAVAALQGQKI